MDLAASVGVDVSFAVDAMLRTSYYVAPRPDWSEQKQSHLAAVKRRPAPCKISD